tara:strand:+ start:969 stop:1544 length:576 start_codon:yes stop_codon:yes gene_type:complete
MPYGLRPVHGAIGNLHPVEYPVADSYAGNIFSGDFVERLVNGTVQRQETTTGLSPVGSHPTLGIATGFRYVDASGTPQWSNYYPASGGTDIFVTVHEDPDQIYLIQSDGNTTSADVGDNATVAGFAASAGSTATGNSGAYLSHSTIGQGALTLRIVGIPEDGSNENLTADKNVLVKILPAVLQGVLSDQIP